MNIRKRIILITCFIFLTLFVASFAFSYLTLFNRFKEVENSQLKTDIARTQDAFASYESNQVLKLVDWANWDDTYRFISDRNSAYIKSNLGPDMLNQINLDLIILINNKGEIVYSLNVDPLQLKEIPFPDSLVSYIQNHKDKVLTENIDSKNGGLITLPEGTLMFASRPILTSNAQGPVMGTLVFGTFIDKRATGYLLSLTHLNTEIYGYNQKNIPSDFELAKSKLKSGSDFVNPLSNSTVAGYFMLKDQSELPDLIVRVDTSRDVYQQGVQTLIALWFLITSVTAGLGIAFYILLSKLVISKIEKISSSVSRIRESKDPELRIPFSSKDNDEISMLAQNINNMISELNEAKMQEINERDQLRIKIEELAEENKKLEDSQRAMMNILEDSKELEKTVKEERDHIKGIFSSIGEGIFVVDKSCNVTLMNPVAENLLGKSLKDVGGRNILDLFSLYKSNQILKDSERPVTTVIKTGKPLVAGLEADMYFVAQNKRFPVAIAATPLKGDGITGAVVALRDITAEKNIEKSIEKQVQDRTLQLSRERVKLQASIGSLPVGFIMTDIQGKILTINQSAIKIIFPLSADMLKANNNYTLSNIEAKFKDIINLKSIVSQCISEKKVLLFKEIMFENRYIKLLFSPIIEESSVLGVVLLIEDITEAKLIQRSRDEFFSIASHELRTPLTAIRGNTALIKDYYWDKITDKDLREMIGDIHKSSTRLISIVNDFLDTSRLELGKMEFKKEKISVEALIDEILKEFNTTGSMKKLYLEAEKSKTKIPLVIADRDRTKQILINLIGNSIKFTEKGGIRITIEPEKTSLKVLVADTGKGISPESQNLLFRKFQQATESIFTRDAINGTGLGLYISRMMAEGMGGEVKLESSVVGKGSVFSLTLPIREKKAVDK